MLKNNEDVGMRTTESTFIYFQLCLTMWDNVLFMCQKPNSVQALRIQWTSFDACSTVHTQGCVFAAASIDLDCWIFAYWFCSTTNCVVTFRCWSQSPNLTRWTFTTQNLTLDQREREKSDKYQTLHDELTVNSLLAPEI